jgi:hypothetical protein
MKATDIFKEYHSFVLLVEDYLQKKETADRTKGSMAIHNMNMAERNLKIEVSKFRMTNSLVTQPKRKTYQGGFNFNHLSR